MKKFGQNRILVPNISSSSSTFIWSAATQCKTVSGQWVVSVEQMWQEMLFLYTVKGRVQWVKYIPSGNTASAWECIHKHQKCQFYLQNSKNHNMYNVLKTWINLPRKFQKALWHPTMRYRNSSTNAQLLSFGVQDFNKTDNNKTDGKQCYFGNLPIKNL